MKKRLISFPDELNEFLVALSKKLGYTVNAIVVQQIWELKNKGVKGKCVK